MRPHDDDHSPSERVGEVSGKRVVLIIMALGIGLGLSALIAQWVRGPGDDNLPPPRPGITPAPP